MRSIVILSLLLFSSCSTTGPNKIKESDFLDVPNKHDLLFDDVFAEKPPIFDKNDKDFCSEKG